MKTTHATMLRSAILFWIVIPILVTLSLAAFVEIAGRFFNGAFENSAAGIGFLLAIVPIFSAHLVFITALFGVVGLFFGLPKDRKFLIIIFVGLAFGIGILHKVYLG